MKTWTYLFYFYLSLQLSQVTYCYYLKNGYHNSTQLNNISFGSCFFGRESNRLEIFDVVMKHDPQMWLWMGDAAYVDEHITFRYFMSTIDVNFTNAEQTFNAAKNEKSNSSKYMIYVMFIYRL